MSYVFGPVPSRRLGLSLGVDLIPRKTCTFDCLYCQIGSTTNRTVEASPFVSVKDILAQLEKKLGHCTPDSITLAGSGEPTLNSQINQVIDAIKKMTDIRVSLLTNGSLFWRDEARERVLNADIIMPTLTTVFENTFNRIHRPHPQLSLSEIIKGLELLRKDYKGDIFLEIVLLAGMNDTTKELKGLKEVIGRISPDRIQLNTVVRPPSDPSAISLDINKLEEIMAYFGENAEIVAEISSNEKSEIDSSIKNFLDMVKRRPLTGFDAAKVLGMDHKDIEDLAKGLLLKGLIKEVEHSGTTFYVSNEKDVDGKN